jgi:hypothetical protein
MVGIAAMWSTGTAQRHIAHSLATHRVDVGMPAEPSGDSMRFRTVEPLFMLPLSVILVTRVIGHQRVRAFSSVCMGVSFVAFVVAVWRGNG